VSGNKRRDSALVSHSRKPSELATLRAQDSCDAVAKGFLAVENCEPTVARWCCGHLKQHPDSLGRALDSDLHVPVHPRLHVMCLCSTAMYVCAARCRWSARLQVMGRGYCMRQTNDSL
jgi:hypothetical protein